MPGAGCVFAVCVRALLPFCPPNASRCLCACSPANPAFKWLTYLPAPKIVHAQDAKLRARFQYQVDDVSAPGQGVCAGKCAHVCVCLNTWMRGPPRSTSFVVFTSPVMHTIHWVRAGHTATVPCARCVGAGRKHVGQGCSFGCQKLDWQQGVWQHGGAAARGAVEHASPLSVEHASPLGAQQQGRLSSTPLPCLHLPLHAPPHQPRACFAS